MIGWLTRFLLFVSAYIPLYVVVAILGWNRFGYHSLIPIVIGLIGLVAIAFIRYYAADTRAGSVAVREVQSRDGDAVPYLLGYLIPFIDLDFEDNAKLLAMLVVFVSIGLTQVAANLIHLNPVLLLLGWHLYEIKDTDGVNSTVITRRKRIKEGSRLRVVTLTENYIHWAKDHE